MMAVGILVLKVQIPGCSSLKEKRRRLKPLLKRLHREFNISVAEIERMDAWQEAVIACALVSNDHGYTQRALQRVVDWLDGNWPDVTLLAQNIELI